MIHNQYILDIIENGYEWLKYAVFTFKSCEAEILLKFFENLNMMVRRF
jgi:hypothetical protein